MSSRSNPAASAWLLAFAGLLAIVVATLWPFRFAYGPLSWHTYSDSFGLAPRTLLDLPRNVLLFMPLGLGVAGVLRARGRSPRRTAVLTIGAGAAVTVAVESLQVFLPGRTPNLSDIAGNTGGAAAALLLLRAWERRRADGRGARASLLPASAALLTATLVLAVVFSWALMRSMRPGGWDADALRVSEGRVQDVIVFDRAIDDEDGERLLRGELPDRLSAAIVAQQGSAPGTARDAGRRVGASGQFTVAFTTVPAAQRERGRMPLAALTGPAATDDLVLARNGGRLIVGWRSPLTGGNHLAPELHFPNVFDAEGPARIVLSVDGSTARLRTTAAGKDDVFLSPDVLFTAIVRETNVWPITVHHAAFWQSTLLFAAIVFVPAGALLGHMRRRSARWPALVLLAGCVLPALYFEGFVSWYRHGLPRPVPLAVGVALTGAGFALVALWPRLGSLAADDPEVGRR